jgi:CxxC-x17-CxxC domain-containing protein
MAEHIKTCSQCGKKFRLIGMELKFYEKQGYPLPDKCPTCRQKRREALRNPQEFFKRPCDSCGKEIITTHNPDKGRIVYCEQCFSEYYNRVDPLLKTEPTMKPGETIQEALDERLGK